MEQYETPVIEFILLRKPDIICTSSNDGVAQTEDQMLNPG